MPWIDAKFSQNTDTSQLGCVTLTFTDVAEFPDTDPFLFVVDRQNIQPANLPALKIAANAALAAERTRRQAAATRKTNLLTALNS